MILNHRIDAMGITRSTVNIMSVAIEEFKAYHTIVDRFIEHIGCYILSITIVASLLVIVGIQSALAE